MTINDAETANHEKLLLDSSISPKDKYQRLLAWYDGELKTPHNGYQNTMVHFKKYPNMYILNLEDVFTRNTETTILTVWEAIQAICEEKFSFTERAYTSGTDCYIIQDKLINIIEHTIRTNTPLTNITAWLHTISWSNPNDIPPFLYLADVPYDQETVKQIHVDTDPNFTRYITQAIRWHVPAEHFNIWVHTRYIMDDGDMPHGLFHGFDLLKNGLEKQHVTNLIIQAGMTGDRQIIKRTRDFLQYIKKNNRLIPENVCSLSTVLDGIHKPHTIFIEDLTSSLS